MHAGSLARSPRNRRAGVAIAIAVLALIGAVFAAIGSAAPAPANAPAAGPTEIELHCSPRSLSLFDGDSAKCSVTLENPAPGSPAPGGSVEFSTNGPGSFSPPSCQLGSEAEGEANCRVSFLPTNLGEAEITATYRGDANHAPASATARVNVTGHIRYAAPGATGDDPCDRTAPCSLATAASAITSGTTVGKGDEIVLLPGEYSTAARDLGIFGAIILPEGVTLHGLPNLPRPTIRLNEEAGLNPFQWALEVNAGDTVSHLRLIATPGENREGGTLLNQNGGTVEDVIVRTSARSTACRVGGGVLRDAVCASDAKDGVGVDARVGTALSNLRNVDALAGGEGSVGLEVNGTAKVGETSVLSAKSTIARGAESDISVAQTGAGKTAVQIDHSAFKTVAMNTIGGGTIAVTGPKEAGNVEAPPQFGEDGFHQLPSSPTVDAGATDAESPSHDIDGEKRILGAGPDIGADELAHSTQATLNCTPGLLRLGGYSNCVATVEDRSAGASTPSGEVSFESDRLGNFSKEGTCTLRPVDGVKASCRLRYIAGEDAETATLDHHVSAHYAGDEIHDPADAAATVTVFPQTDPTVTAVACDPASVAVGSATSCTATVIDSSPVGASAPEGEVSFASDSPGDFDADSCELQASAADSASCHVTYTPTAVGSGKHEIGADYGGDDAHIASSGSTTVSVGVATQTDVACAPSENLVGQGVDCTATVSVPGDAGAAVNGHVVFESDAGGTFSVAACDLAQSGPTSSCKVRYLTSTVGVHRVTATYQGEPGHAESSGSTTETATGTTSFPPTETSVSCAPTALRESDYTQCVATVTDISSSPTPVLGQVGIKSDGPRSTIPVGGFCKLAAASDGTSSCSFEFRPSATGKSRTQLVIGAYSAAGEDSHSHADSEGRTELQVSDSDDSREASTTAVSCAPSAPHAGEASQCTVTVSAGEGSTLAPRGRIQLATDANGVFSPMTSCELEAPASLRVASCSVQYLPLATGTHTLTASFEGDVVHRPSQGKAQLEASAETTPRNPTVTSFSCDQAQIRGGETTNCTATVMDEGASPSALSGQLAFGSDHDGSFSSPTCDLAGTSTASCEVTYRPAPFAGAGAVAHQLSATYGGDTAHQPSQGQAGLTALGEEFGEGGSEEGATTATDLSCAPNLLDLNGSSTCTATVEDIAAQAAKAPEGQVSFSTNALGDFSKVTCALKPVEGGAGNASTCAVAYTARDRGEHLIAADYSGEPSHRFSTDTDLVRVRTEVEEGGQGGRDATETALSCQPSLVNLNGHSTCTATVRDTEQANPTALDGGEVRFQGGGEGAFSASTCQLAKSSGALSCAVDFEAGDRNAHQITATFQADASHASSTDTDTVSVRSQEEEDENGQPGEKDPTSTSISCDPNPTKVSGSSACTVVVRDTVPSGQAAPSGRIALEAPAGTFAGTCDLSPTAPDSSSCQAVYSAPASAGDQTLGAKFAGDDGHEASEGSTVLSIKADTATRASATTISCESNSAYIGASTDCTVKVKDTTSSGTFTPKGHVGLATDRAGSFDREGCDLVSVNGGEAAGCEFSYTPLEAGAHDLTAVFGGDEHLKPSTGKLALAVAAVDQTETTLTCAPNLLDLNGHSNCAVVVTDTEATNAPHGTVHFSSSSTGVFGAESCDLAPLAGGSSSGCEVDYLANARSEHLVTALYDGEASHAGSTDTDSITVRSEAEEEEEHQSGKDTTETALTCAPSLLDLGSPSTCTAVVSDTAASPKAPLNGGEVKFEADGAGDFSASSCQLTDAGGVLSCGVEYTPSERGAQHLTASFQADAAHLGSADTELVTVRSKAEEEEEHGGDPGRDETKTQLACAPSSLILGGESHCTATVEDVAALNQVALESGEVQFTLSAGTGTFSAESCQLSGAPGTLACAVNFTPAAAGDSVVRAGYQGDDDHQASGDTATVTATAGNGGGEAGATATTLSCEPNLLDLGEGSACTATVLDTATTGATPPRGTVEFGGDAEGTFSAQSCELTTTGADTSACEVEYTGTARGDHQISARYQGEQAHLDSADTDSVHIRTQAEEEEEHQSGKDTTETTLTCAPGLLDQGHATTCTAAVADTAQPVGTALGGGEVKFGSDASGSFNVQSCQLADAGGTLSCAVEYTATARGPHHVTASFQADDDHIGSADTELVTVRTAAEEEEEHGGDPSKDATATTLACAPATVALGTASHCTATVADTEATNPKPLSGGEVLFSLESGSGELSSQGCTLTPSGGSLSCAVDFTPAGEGDSLVKAGFIGDATHQASSDTATVTATSNGTGGDETQTTLLCRPNVLNLGGSSSCTATVTDTAANGASAPNGRVRFESGANGSFSAAGCDLAPAGANAASCAVEYQANARGEHLITAAYAGEATHRASSDDDLVRVRTKSEEEQGTGNRDATETALTCAPSTLDLNAATVCHVRVIDVNQTNPVALSGGKVEFGTDSSGTFDRASCDLTGSGSALECAQPVQYTARVRGEHRITATFVADSSHVASADTELVTVRTPAEEEEEHGGDPSKDTTATTLACAPASVALGGASHCTATVEDTEQADPTDLTGGHVDFSLDSGSGSFSAQGCDLAGSGPAFTCEVSFTPASKGNHSVRATFGGDVDHQASHGNAVVTATGEDGGGEEPGKDTTATTLACAPISVALGGSAHCTATVADTEATSPKPLSGGEVRFSLTQGAGNLSAGSCQLTETGGALSCKVDFAPSVVGPSVVRGAYLGDATHQGSADSAAITATEAGGGDLDATETALSCQPNVLDLNKSTDCVATVTDTATGATTPRGEVQFSSSAAGLFSPAGCTLQGSGASASCEVSFNARARGDHTITAAYQGSTSHKPSADTDLVRVRSAAEEGGGGSKDATETALSCQPNVLNLNGLTTCTVAVTDTEQTNPTVLNGGEVKFLTDSTGTFSAQSCQLADTGGTLSCAVEYTATVRGPHGITATFQADAAHESSFDTDSARVRSKAEEEEFNGGGTGGDTTQTTFACAPDPVRVGSASHCVATVTDTATGGARPLTSGEVLVTLTEAEGALSAQSCQLTGSGGPLSCAVDFTPSRKGSHVLRAAYQGDESHAASAGSYSLRARTLGEEGEPTQTSLSCEPANVIVGGGSACTATVTTGAGQGTPSGEVTLSNDHAGGFSNPCVLAPAGADAASCQTVYKPTEVGTHHLAAGFGGDGQHAESSGSFDLLASAPNGGHTTTTAFSCEPNPVSLGGAVACTVTVTDQGAGASTPTGLVAFASTGAGSFVPGGCVLFAEAPGKARCQVIYTPTQVGAAPQSLTALYSGDAAHEPSEANVQLEVTAPNGGHETTTALACDPAEVAVGQPTSCTVTVTDTDGAPVAPGRAVIFASDSPGTFATGGCHLEGGTAAASCKIVYTPSEAGSGTHKLFALYEGDTGHEPSRGETTIKVKAPIHPTQTQIACAPSPVAIGSASTCTATVVDTAAGASAPSGQVTFQSNAQGAFSASGGCNLAASGADRSSCQLTYTPQALATGTHQITASYQGDGGHDKSQGGFALQIVGPPDTRIVKHPKKVTPQTAAIFTFAADQSPVTFQCKLDKLAFKACKSPFNTKTLRSRKVGKGKRKRLKYVFKLRKGPHVLQVQAISASGQVDPTPAVFKWRVGKPVRKHHKPKKHKKSAGKK
jgi:hypothetical protein